MYALLDLVLTILERYCADKSSHEGETKKRDESHGQHTTVREGRRSLSEPCRAIIYADNKGSLSPCEEDDSPSE